MTQTLADRWIWISGAASGIGRATALLLASRGAHVICLDRDEPGCRAVAESITAQGGQAEARQLEVTDETAWAKLVEQLPRLDGAVHAAGVASGDPIANLTLGEWRRILAVNLDGVFLGTRAALQLLRRQRGGSIVNVSSVSGLRALPSAAAYCTSKAAVCMFSRVAARECLQAGEPIRVNTVCPGGVKTPLWRSQPFFADLVQQTGSEEGAYAALAGEAGRFAEPEEIASAIAYLLEDTSRFVTGTEMVIDGGFLAG